MNVSKIEKSIGIETFLTHSEGIGGKLRSTPQDFCVKEIFNYPKEFKDGKFTIAEITAVNWETNLLIREISQRLRISRNRIGFAGTKDKRAITTQLMSFYNIDKDKLRSIKINDLIIKNVYSSEHPIKIGDLNGNSFDIVIRNLDDGKIEEKIEETFEIIKHYCGVPNFFGIQRFGVIRPITHLVGKHIVFNDFENAVMTYIANPLRGEGENSYKLRKRLEETRNFSEAFRNYPQHLTFEKAMLNKLVKDNEDYVGALLELPKNLLTMFIYAYQSYLFNKILSIRMKKNIPINEAIVGDIILPIRKGIIDLNEISANENNIEKINEQIKRGRAFVSGPLFGSDTNLAKGEMGEIERKVIEKEKIDIRDFTIPEIPFMSSEGSRRILLSPIKNLSYKIIDNDMNKDKKALKVAFDLHKGSYATSLLREIMKSPDITAY
ncbi:MAG: tRNA pseudouridine(13) synthase TruD [Candidatus Thermoplasmatota archaeon]|nr:tRNA pseudouridine(13) synthase TruD [Candidatus Thermoplasmatota archaeon]